MFFTMANMGTKRVSPYSPLHGYTFQQLAESTLFIFHDQFLPLKKLLHGSQPTEAHQYTPLITDYMGYADRGGPEDLRGLVGLQSREVQEPLGRDTHNFLG